MAVIKHDIAPDGDLELVLRDHSTQKVTPCVWFRYNIKEDESHDEPDEDKVDLPQMSSPIPSPEVSGTDDDPIEIRMRVSSHHLTFASPVFEKMAKGPWKEAHRPAFASRYSRKKYKHSKVPAPLVRQVATTGWNAHALVVVMNIIHGRHRDVPRHISLEFFVDFAVIVDYYHCEKAVHLAAELWHNLIYKPPSRYGKAAIMWLYISWVFSWPQVFSNMARLIVKQGTGLEMVDTKDLPVGHLLAKLDKKRQESIKDILKSFDDLIEKLKRGGDSANCTIKCRFMKLGMLVIEQLKMQSLEPPLGYNTNTVTCTGHSISSIIEMMEKFPKAEFYESFHGLSHTCIITAHLQPTMDSILKAINQLSITEYQR